MTAQYYEHCTTNCTEKLYSKALTQIRLRSVKKYIPCNRPVLFFVRDALLQIPSTWLSILSKRN